MTHVTVTINGKAYRMACDEGQEQHLIALSERFNAYVSQLKGAFGEIGDQRLTVMAAIMVTDELAELGTRVRKLEAELAAMKASREEVLAQIEEHERAAAGLLETAAARIETLAHRLAVPKAGGSAAR